MGSILMNGVFLPAKGERNCYEGLAANWTALDGLIGGYNFHISNTTIHVTAEDKATWNGKADASALTAHTGDTTIHVTAEDKQAWNGKANDADVVHKSGTETVPGKKTFTDELTASRNTTHGAIWLQNASYDPKTNGQSGVSTKSFSINFLTALSDTFGSFSCFGIGDKTLLRFTARYFVDSQTVTEDSVEYTVYGDGTRSFRPRNNNNAILGESTRKWKNLYANQINSLTPSSLSLPDLNNAVDISGYITNLAGSPNIYSPPANGYIILRSTTANVLGVIENTTGMGSYSRGSNQVLAVYLPVVKNSSISIYAICSSLTHAKFIPCQGNI